MAYTQAVIDAANNAQVNGAVTAGAADAKTKSDSSAPASAATSALMLAILATINFLEQTNQTMAATSSIAGELAEIKTAVSSQMEDALAGQMVIIKGDTDPNKIQIDTTTYQYISQKYQTALTNIDAPTQETSGTVEQGANGEKTDTDLAQTIVQANVKDLLR